MRFIALFSLARTRRSHAKKTHPFVDIETPPRPQRPCATMRATNRDVRSSRHTKRHSGEHARRLPQGIQSIGFIVDSGCSWHVRPFADNLLNTRPTNETIDGI
eukprot:3047414-Pleurochrysis_carterae.AAC.2